MSILLKSTRIQGNVLSKKEIHEKNYELLKEAHFFWGFIDLKNSSNYRIIHGPQAGYVRSESFFSLISEVVAPCSDVRKIKEIGDEVFLCSQNFRSIFECILMVWFIAKKLSSSLGSNRYPFAVRAAIGSGPAKRLDRGSDDYIGSPIDQLARIMSIRPDNVDIRLYNNIYKDCSDIIDEYSDFISTSDPELLAPDKAKEIALNIYYRDISISIDKFESFNKHFAPWNF